MKRILLGLVVSLGLAAVGIAQERITLSAPETKPSNTAYRLERLTLDVERGAISLQLLGVNGEPVSCVYGPTTNPTGATLLAALNKANLSTAYAGNATTGSLTQRIFHRLVVMNEAPAVCGVSLAGSLTGSVP